MEMFSYHLPSPVMLQIILLQFLTATQKDLLQPGIELGAHAFAHDGGTFLKAHGFLVDALAHQGIVDISHRHDSGLQGNHAAHQSLGIASAVPALVVVSGLIRR